jgi:hypothetical protein
MKAFFPAKIALKIANFLLCLVTLTPGNQYRLLISVCPALAGLTPLFCLGYSF